MRAMSLTKNSLVFMDGSRSRSDDFKRLSENTLTIDYIYRTATLVGCPVSIAEAFLAELNGES